ncbi:MAG TPA: lipocalin-like domain-containing protein, partial [Chitinophagales bacterium]|nr:lipocalin-like domain-containing protein [Chitinophagales bacterium]
MNPRAFFLLILLLLLFHPSFSQWWKHYPYREDGTVLTFPDDEGYHPGNEVEWWYTTGHVTGDSTGTHYSYMVSFFYYDTIPTFDGFRIFNLANDNTGEFYDETLPVTSYTTLSEDHLEIKAAVGFPGAPHQEEWTTLRDSMNNLLPFEYHLKASQANGSIDMTYRSLVRPLILENGFFYQGATGYTYYYSLTKIEISGTITMNGVTETVRGTGWVDRQWGAFNPFYGEKYEWFSIQLSNGMAMNVWNIFTPDNRIPDTSTYRLCSVYVDDSTDWELHDFQLTRLQFNWMPDSQQCYSRSWRLIDQHFDLTFTTLHTNSEVQLPFRFFEGATTVAGTVYGYPVTGVGFAECLHSYSHPQVELTLPAENASWDGAIPFTWRLLNPDDGRPVYYDVEISSDNAAFTKIAHALSDTFYQWSPDVNAGTNLWLKITGYSIDSSLTGTYRM